MYTSLHICISFLTKNRCLYPEEKHYEMRLFKALPWIQVFIKRYDEQSVFNQNDVHIATPMPEGVTFVPSRVLKHFRVVPGDLEAE